MFSFKEGYTALIYAAYNGEEEITRLLVDAGASLDVRNNVRTFISFVFTHIPSNFDIVLYYR